MSNISSFNSSVAGYDNRNDMERFRSLSSERSESLRASENRSLELELTTKDGDTVTLSTASFMDFASLSYDKSGKVSNGYETASAKMSSREMTLASGSQFTFSVQGSLSEDELNDIENIVKTLDDVFYEMSTGDMDEAMAKALEMGEGYETVSGFNADLNYSSSYIYEEETATRSSSYGSPGNAKGFGRFNNPGMMQRAYSGEENSKGIEELFKDSSMRLLDMMLEELDKMKDENQNIPRRAAEPVDKLLAHHMEQLSQGNMADSRGAMQENGTVADGYPGGESNLNDENPLNGINILDEGSVSNLNDDFAAKGKFLLNELSNAREGMKSEFKRMMSDMPSFFKV
ncbi:hypothetical protein MTBBW1_1310011 [Desulfamplus magnetovallimortis]|uniref:DUF5610 domain-containing protein n=1 Tax=Desulfamplus magnetovallimortis TaxID=1246637 RepID=A0A1W1H773_9BACT|nr:hypothetical protein [Desulfamplus magnetovallimortis]SLM28313.1 hypothetical protein MTBBW1_1310011 [Desulfamplus magnetovallimortis]